MHGIEFMDLLFNTKDVIDSFVRYFGVWCYVIFFIIIFSETGLVVAPFLPGDSLLFMLGAVASTGKLNIFAVLIVLSVAAILGNTVNYKIGMTIGEKAFTSNSKFFKKEHLLKTHEFFEKHGGKTLVLSRFIPIFRTFAPFVAGIGEMSFGRFSMYNITGALLWVVSITVLGYFFGELPFVEDNFYIVVIAIIAISVLPPVYAFIHSRFKSAEDES